MHRVHPDTFFVRPKLQRSVNIKMEDPSKRVRQTNEHERLHYLWLRWWTHDEKKNIPSLEN